MILVRAEKYEAGHLLGVCLAILRGVFDSGRLREDSWVG